MGAAAPDHGDGILLIGALLFGVGLLAAFPLVLCVSTAAYRQLFDDTDNTGFLAE